jgi:hypothetical protein
MNEFHAAACWSFLRHGDIGGRKYWTLHLDAFPCMGHRGWTPFQCLHLDEFRLG